MGGAAQRGQQQQEKKNSAHTGPVTISRTMPRGIAIRNGLRCSAPFPFAGPRLIPLA
jgi:hypothetical protein